ncbi:12931_t:CDS:2 [Rhizophagus irregularis]|nr:12931_t:CDS:2 [Rhizophagus irregularis]
MISLSNSIRFSFITLISSLLLTVPLSHAYSSPDENSLGSKSDFYVVTIIPLTLNALNLLGSLYIFYRTYLRWKFDYDKITLLSSYTASNASALSNATKEEDILWPSPYCEILGFFNTAFTLLNMLLVGSLSITTWLRVVQEYYFSWGRYDYKVWSPICLISFIIPLISVHDFGSQVYWCGINEYDNSLISTFLLVTILLTLITIVFCYMHVLKLIHNVREDSPIENSEADIQRHNNIEKKILKKVMAYILVFIFQYIPLLLSDIFKLLKINYIILLNALSLSAISIGGISNLIQYIRNEKFLLVHRNNNDLNDNINLEEREQTKSSKL